MTLAKFIDSRLQHSDYVTIWSPSHLVLYRGLVADIPYRLAVKSELLVANITRDDITIHVIYHNT